MDRCGLFVDLDRRSDERFELVDDFTVLDPYGTDLEEMRSAGEGGGLSVDDDDGTIEWHRVGGRVAKLLGVGAQRRAGEVSRKARVPQRPGRPSPSRDCSR